MRIVIETRPYHEQRYDTNGDWYYVGGTLHIGVAEEVEGYNEQFLIAFHELVEAWLCRERGIRQGDVDIFDMANSDLASTLGVEVGDLRDAPYAKEHRFAMMLEHLMAHELGVYPYGRIE